MPATCVLEDTENGWLKSKLKVENGLLHFYISNSLKTINEKKGKGGVGLENIRDRLQLLFPGLHELKIENGNGMFSVDLKITLG